MSPGPIQLDQATALTLMLGPNGSVGIQASRSLRSERTVAITRAEACLASATAHKPTAPAPPCTSTMRPSTGPAICTARWAVMPGIPRHAPCSNSTVADSGTAFPRACSGPHIRGRPQNDPDLGRVRAQSGGVRKLPVRWLVRQSLGEPEVEHLDLAIRRDLDIRRLEIAMDDPVVVSGRQGVGNLARKLESFGERNRPPPQALGERLAGNELEDEVPQRVLVVLDAVDRGDARMVQRREDHGPPAGTELRRSSSCANSSGRTLIATSRPSFRVSSPGRLRPYRPCRWARGSRSGRVYDRPGATRPGDDTTRLRVSATRRASPRVSVELRSLSR